MENSNARDVASLHRYGTSHRRYDLGRYGQVDYQHWCHPLNLDINLNEASVAGPYGFLEPGDMAIDIGAYTGDTAVPMAAAVGARGLVLAFEPNPYTYAVLAENSVLNHRNIVALPYGIHDSIIRKQWFRYSDPGFCNGGHNPDLGHTHRLQVKTMPLTLELVDAFRDNRKLSFIKIDAEGSDVEILWSLRSILEVHKPVVRLELYLTMTDQDRCNFLRIATRLGYEFRGLDLFQAADWLRRPDLKNHVADVTLDPI